MALEAPAWHAAVEGSDDCREGTILPAGQLPTLTDSAGLWPQPAAGFRSQSHACGPGLYILYPQPLQLSRLLPSPYFTGGSSAGINWYEGRV
jgi:hypothetical protein